MSTTATISMPLVDMGARSVKPRKGFWARLIETRSAAAEERVQSYLALQSDERLQGLGMSTAEIERLRSRPHTAQAFWI